MDIRKTFLNKAGTRTLYFVALFALAAVAAAGFLLVPTNTNTVSAQDSATSAPANQLPREVLAAALNFRSASDFAVFAEKGISDNGGSKVGGDVGVSSEAAEIKGLSGSNVKGMLRSGESAIKSQKDFSSSFSYINHLPCMEVADSNLGGKTFTPGVYCLESANLAGQMMLNAENDGNGIFIFRVKDSLTAQAGSGMLMTNGATAANVFFLTNDSATVAESSDFRGSILARNNISVRSGASITGRALSLNGSVELENSTVALQVGFLQICKEALDAPAGGLVGRVFFFTVAGQTVSVPVGACSSPIQVPTGPNVITEDATNRNLAGGDPVTGRFILTDVNRTSGPGTLTSVNRQLRTATVTVPEGTIQTETVITFINQFAITAFIEICKEGDDSGVAGPTTGTPAGRIFTFTVAGVFTGAGAPGGPGSTTLAQFFAPLGGCTGLIAVPVAVPGGPLPFPVRSSVDVTEIVPTGTTFTGGFTLPADRLIAVNTTAGPISAPTAGGLPLVRDLAGRSIRAVVIEGGSFGAAANQTTIFFRNRTDADLKICKIAGPGVPQGTFFLFRIDGNAPPTALTGLGSQANNAVGPEITRFIAVPAGPNPGGFCRFVSVVDDRTGTTGDTTLNDRQLFQTDRRIRIEELGTTLDQTDPITIPGVDGNVIVSRITNLNGTESTVNLNQRVIRFDAIAGTNVVEYVNIIFRPTLLKVCKVAADAGTLNQIFTFDVVASTNGGLLPAFSRTLTVQAGAAANGDVTQNGFCDFVEGQFNVNGLVRTGEPGEGPLFRFFNAFTTVSVTERARPGFTLVSITSPTSTGLTVSGSTGTFSGNNGLVQAVSEIVFTNRVSTGGPTPTPTVTGSPTPTVTVQPPLPTPTATVGPTPSITVVPPLRKVKKGGSGLLSSM